MSYLSVPQALEYSILESMFRSVGYRFQYKPVESNTDTRNRTIQMESLE